MTSAVTSIPGGVTVGDSGLCCCVPCLLSAIHSLCLLKGDFNFCIRGIPHSWLMESQVHKARIIPHPPKPTHSAATLSRFICNGWWLTAELQRCRFPNRSPPGNIPRETISGLKFSRGTISISPPKTLWLSKRPMREVREGGRGGVPVPCRRPLLIYQIVLHLETSRLPPPF